MYFKLKESRNIGEEGKGNYGYEVSSGCPVVWHFEEWVADGDVAFNGYGQGGVYRTCEYYCYDSIHWVENVKITRSKTYLSYQYAPKLAWLGQYGRIVATLEGLAKVSEARILP